MSGFEWLNLNLRDVRYEVGYKSSIYTYIYVYFIWQALFWIGNNVKLHM